MKRTILLVEDNEHIIKINGDTLAEAGYRVLEAQSVEQARAVLEEELPDLIVLDIMLPDGDGMELCRSIRGGSGVPILFLSAKKKSVHIVKGLRAGGDDYLTKPYDLDVLLARIEALLRRAAPAARQTILRFGLLEINFKSRRALLSGADLLLTAREFALLEALSIHQSEYIPAEELYEALWGLEAGVDVRTVKEHIYRLRRKLEGAPVRIESARGYGYRLTPAQVHKGHR